MNTFQFSFLMIIIAISVPYSVGEELPEQFNCMHILMRMAKESMKAITSCSKRMKAQYANNKEYADHIACLPKCVFNTTKVSNEELIVTEESLVAAVKKFIPTEGMLEDLITMMFVPCKTEASNLDPSEDNCLSYAKFALCVQSGYETFLNTSKHCLPRKKRQ